MNYLKISKLATKELDFLEVKLTTFKSLDQNLENHFGFGFLIYLHSIIFNFHNILAKVGSYWSQHGK